jgi:hypothetical protein
MGGDILFLAFPKMRNLEKESFATLVCRIFLMLSDYGKPLEASGKNSFLRV